MEEPLPPKCMRWNYCGSYCDRRYWVKSCKEYVPEPQNVDASTKHQGNGERILQRRKRGIKTIT